MHKSFAAELSKLVVESMFNNYTDNHDIYRFGPAPIEKKDASVKSAVRKKLNEKGYYSVASTIDYVKQRLALFSSKVDYFEYLYNLLEDDYSRDLLVKVCAYRIMGSKKIKLPMNNPEYWSKIEEIEKTLKVPGDGQLTVGQIKLSRYNLTPIGYPINLYFSGGGIYFDFVYKCYSYNQAKAKIEVEPGDFVIDGGACTGDTALFFAHSAGKKGKVYSFEFVPANLNILQQNIDLNPSLKENISLVKHPLWSKGGIPVYYEAEGPGTRVSMEKISEKANVVNTATIDELVNEGKIEKVDFIKMDIEGAETEALKGAEKTIRKFKPKLAICLYHSEKDFKDIPEFIKNLNLGYKFYFNHYTMHAEESVLFCIA